MKMMKIDNTHTNIIATTTTTTTTDLKSGVEAWKVVHKVASRFSINNHELQCKLKIMLNQYCVGCGQLSSGSGSSGSKVLDFAQYTKDSYWGLVLLMVLGSAEDTELCMLYKDAWTSCIDALSSPLAHTCSFYTYIPLPVVVRYRLLSSRLRSRMMNEGRCR